MSLPTAEQHPLYKQLQECVELAKRFKSDLYPKNINTKKYYSEKLPVKGEINELKTAIKGLEKSVVSILKQRNEVVKVPKSNSGGNSLLRLKPEISSFIGTQKKGLNDMYLNTLLTQWFTNYFYVNNMASGVYIIPNKEIISLFKQSLVLMGVVDERGNLVSTKNEAGNTVKGFKFIKLQQLFKDHIVLDPETKKRATFKCEDAKILSILTKEKEHMEKIKNARHEVENHKKIIENLEKNKKKAELYGDKEEAMDKEATHRIAYKKSVRNLQQLCKDANFPLNV
jgi:hypothetical protein